MKIETQESPCLDTLDQQELNLLREFATWSQAGMVEGTVFEHMDRTRKLTDELRQVQELIANMRQKTGMAGLGSSSQLAFSFETLHVTDWTAAGVIESCLDCFIVQVEDSVFWHAVCLQETFKRVEKWRFLVFTPALKPQKGFRCPAIVIRVNMSENTEIFDSGIRWLAARVNALKTLVVLCICHTWQTECGGTLPGEEVGL